MTVLRSREVIPKTLKPSPPPFLEPSTPSRMDAVSNPPPSSTPSPLSSPPSVLGLRLGSEISRASGGRRRSLRLASSGKQTPGGEGVTGSPMSGGNGDDEECRISYDGVSPSTVEEKNLEGKVELDLNFSPKDVKKRVPSLDATVLSSDSPDAKEVKDGVFMNLRSGSRVVRRRVEVIDVDSDQDEKDGDLMVCSSKGYSYEEKGKATLVCGSGGTVEMARDGIVLNEGKRREIRYVNEGKGKDKVAGEDEWLSMSMPDTELGMHPLGDCRVNLNEGAGTGGCLGGEEIRGGREYGFEDKGKGVMVVESDWLSLGRREVKSDEDPVGVDHSLDVNGLVNQREAQEGGQQNDLQEVGNVHNHDNHDRRYWDRVAAREVALKFAFFEPQQPEEEKEEDEEEDNHQLPEPVDWPGPFSTAHRIIEERQEMLKARQANSASAKSQSSQEKVLWKPLLDCNKKRLRRQLPPSLKDLCLRVLSENATEMESLEGVPDALRHQLTLRLCGSRKMGFHVLQLLASSSPTEIRVCDCSWATEEQLEEIFAGCTTDHLTVLQLDLCGRGMPDYVLCSTLARAPKSLPLLSTLSLRGAYRLSDDGLRALVSSAPQLSSVNLGHCSLVSSTGIIYMAEKLESVLRKLYIDECQLVDALLILPALKKLKNLEALSVAGLQTVSNKFVRELVSVCGPNLKELDFKDCGKLTGASTKIIGERCPQLCALDLGNLHKLNDSALEYLASGCRSIQKLKLCHTAFSDEAIAAFLEASGESLTELSLNNVGKVAHKTAIAISQRCSSNLQTLDLSFCRKMNDEALGLFVDSCSSLRILKLFGCSQVTDIFLDGHSNPQVNIMGQRGSILEYLPRPCFL